MSDSEIKSYPSAASLADLDLLIANAKKDPQAFALLYDRFLSPLYRYIFQRVRNRQDAEEITSQTFLAAYEAFSAYHHRGYFAAWLFAIARKKLADHYRKAHFDQSLEDTSDLVEDPQYLGKAVSGERLGRLRQKVADLAEDEQEMLRLRFSAELSFKEMGVLLHKNEEAVKKSFYRLLARLQSQMEDENV